MDAERVFNDMGVDAIIGTLLLRRLEVSIDELIDPVRFKSVQNIISYLKQFSNDTVNFILSRAVGKNTDKIAFMEEYITLLKDKQTLSDSLAETDKELLVNPNPELEIKKSKLETELKNVNDTIDIYNK